MSTTSLKSTQSTQLIDPPRRSDGSFLMGDFPAFRNDPVSYFLDTGKVGPMIRFRMAYIDNLLVTDADFAKEILQTKNKNYIKEPRLMRIIETGAAKTLFSSDGDEWLWRRRLMQPAFHRKQIEQFCDAIVSETDKVIEGLEPGTKQDMDEAMTLVTMMIIGRTMFNVDMAGDSSDLYLAYHELSKSLIDRITNPVAVPIWLPTPGNRRFWQAQNVIVTSLNNIIEQRFKSGEPQNDLLDMLLGMVNVEGGFTQDQMVFEMSSIVFAGHETTAKTLSWVLYMLTQFPEVEQKVIDEIKATVGDKKTTMAHLAQLPYLTMVINETMRLYPAARATTRRAIEADEVGGYKIRSGENIFINIQGIQRDERYWENPEAFDPDRFSPERSANRHKWAFFPFLDGPRKCIGEQLSRVEMQLILVRLLQRFSFELPQGAVVEEEAGFVLQPKGGLDLILRNRTAS